MLKNVMDDQQTYSFSDDHGGFSLIKNWDFHSSTASFKQQVLRVYEMWRKASSPKYLELKLITKFRRKWIVYFIYLPDSATLTQQHLYTLKKLQHPGHSILVVCASSAPADVPPELSDYCDALYWKETSGFDFSAYALALRKISEFQHEADVFLMNDSVLGPFCKMPQLWSHMQWDLTGFTANHQVENHIQSYAFFLRGLNAHMLQDLAKVFLENRAYDTYRGAVLNQETRLAQFASKTMTVGAKWYAPPGSTIDPSLFAAVPLLKMGVPFLKRALFTKHGGIISLDELNSVLSAHQHPANFSETT